MNYVMQNNNLKWADLVVILTGRALVYKHTNGNFNPRGATWVGAACSFFKVAFVSDTGSDGVPWTSAHEISHALGASHDGEGASANCPARYRHLMTAFHARRKSTYSGCSLASINRFLKKPEAICLFGQSRSALDENPQLKQQRSEACQGCLSECQYIESIATKKPCYFRCTISNRNKKGAKIDYYQYDKDGTPCSNDDPFKKCKNGQCK
ncbi:venom metalloproteinase antarease-like TserMP_B [Dermacentor variabilis]|uniref:venom metalloproteinase antarease-like TserMP_B n=1 Tax=Dermacentor variabilis TaxID=34621 RepID=UPI003F5C4A0A